MGWPKRSRRQERIRACGLRGQPVARSLQRNPDSRSSPKPPCLRYRFQVRGHLLRPPYAQALPGVPARSRSDASPGNRCDTPVFDHLRRPRGQMESRCVADIRGSIQRSDGFDQKRWSAHRACTGPVPCERSPTGRFGEGRVRGLRSAGCRSGDASPPVARRPPPRVRRGLRQAVRRALRDWRSSRKLG